MKRLKRLSGITFKPYGNKLLTFDNLKSSVALNDQEVGSFELQAGKEYILNPCKQAYFIEAFEYGSPFSVSMQVERKTIGGFKLNFAAVDDKAVVGYFKETNDLLIEKQWDWGLEKVVPKQIEITRGNRSSTRTKIFRKYNFLNFHEQDGK